MGFCRRNGDALDNVVTLRMIVQAGVQIRLCDVVGVRKGFLTIRMRNVFTQHAHHGRVNVVGEYVSLVDDQLDEGAVVAHGPVEG